MAYEITKKTVSYKYRQGSGWIVGTYSTRFRTYILSDEKPYLIACALVRESRACWNTRTQSYTI
jgi:hypothetical protein